MIVQREELYFEARVVDFKSTIRWYGELYQSSKMDGYLECTVYVRDDGEYLYIYSLENDEFNDDSNIKAEFILICKVKKFSNKFRYGKLNK